jgi:hypothetical protein
VIRWVTHNCQAGACSACNWPFTTCAHECHVDGAARAVEVKPAVVPEPMLQVENPAFTALVEKAATQLCIDAEPGHASAAPCLGHLHEARREVMGRWLGQQGQVA